MRWVVRTLLVLLLAVSFLLVVGTPSRQVLPRPAPDFLLPDLDGRAVRFTQLRGKVVFLNIWTTWCPPCRKEMPTLEALNRKFRDEDFIMLAASQDVDGANTVAPYLRQGGFTMPVLIDTGGEVGNRYGVTGYPESFIIDRQGQVVFHHIGYRDWSRADVEKAVRRLIEVGVWTSPGAGGRGEQTPLVH